MRELGPRKLLRNKFSRWTIVRAPIRVEKIADILIVRKCARSGRASFQRELDILVMILLRR